MPSRSAKQARFFAAAAHDPKIAAAKDVRPSVAKEWNREDAKTGILKKKTGRSR